MGRLLQAVGLFFMIGGLFGFGLLWADGTGVLAALAEPCTIKGAAYAVPPIVTPPPTATPAPTPSTRPPAAELPSYPSFAPTEDLVGAPPTPTPSPSPAPTASPPAAAEPPCPVHRRHLFGDGPVEFSGTGGVDLGTHRLSAANASSAQNNVNLSMDMRVSRRTEKSSFVVDQIFGAANGLYNLGQVNVGYNTPEYLVTYGQVNGPSDTQLSSGSFNRGVTFGVPHGADEIDLIGARTTGMNGEGFRVGGIRHTRSYAKGLLVSQSLYFARGDQSGGTDVTLDTAIGRYRSGQTYRGEIALTRTHGIPGLADATRFAYAAHADFAGAKTSTSIGYTSIPDGYITLGQQQFGQTNLTFTNRRPIFSRGTLTFDFGDMTTLMSGLRSRTLHETTNLSMPLSSWINSQWLVNFAQNSSQGQLTNERDAGVALSEQIKGFSLQQSAQGSSVTSNLAASAATQTQYQFSLAHALFGGFASVQNVSGRSYGPGAVGTQLENSVSYVRQYGRKTELGVTVDDTRSTIVNGDAISSTNQATTTYSLLRRFSQAVGMRVTYGKTHQSGVFGGSTGYVNVDIVGPLAIGTSARYAGRANPNLPSIVQGHVYLQNEASSYGLVGNRGISNVLVTLDGGFTQRTDATGAYEFRFVRPGSHTITISSGTLPIGVIPDSSTQSFVVQGGQIINVDFAAGQFAGVGGKVLEHTNGTSFALPGVLLVVDKTERGYTGADGSYQIGHLSPGKHVVAIAPESLPATVAVSGAAEREVTVVDGAVAPLDWTLTGLGSIRGVVLFAPDAGFGDLTGAKDVYVVADPGQHAAITDPEGHFIIDNLPVGQYTLSVDQDTLPDGQTVVQGPDGPVNVTGEDAVEGITFKVGPAAKQVVFTFAGGKNAVVTADFKPDRVPPNALVDLVVTTDQKHPKSVVAQGDPFGTMPLHFDASRRAWIGKLALPATIANGDYPIHVTVQGDRNGSADATLTVNNALPLIYARGTPSAPRAGQLVHVVARVLVDVHGGEQIVFEDGATMTLPDPKGHVVAFSVRVPHALPYRGMLLTRRGERLPFVIGP